VLAPEEGDGWQWARLGCSWAVVDGLAHVDGPPRSWASKGVGLERKFELEWQLGQVMI
jgi:hypothetical protein